ncbi:(2Fe-2S)-binding protein [Curvibacter sp. RS43]|uniref:(2Fe-2S)-binding protein n=1 Tax=Curvibacter microcysteis TaxID=3026419 RepID=UPI00235FE933|nr:(2Fe-2S)-binding protein [Curvibacter sp. RS43]MDD0811543.1 (2Fe-2S)-binding protein [Curvibacter sp. RS43]
MTPLKINEQTRQTSASDETPLLWVLRDELSMTGTKFGCGMALCGACTVHVNGQATRACLTPVGSTKGQAIHTIEHMHNDKVGRVVQQAWVDLNVAQCGYCQAGQIMSAVALLKTTPRPNDLQIDNAMSGNLCRCGTYPRIRAAIHLAARRLAGDKA